LTWSSNSKARTQRKEGHSETDSERKGQCVVLIPSKQVPSSNNEKKIGADRKNRHSQFTRQVNLTLANNLSVKRRSFISLNKLKSPTLKGVFRSCHLQK